jgi:hypothetical protein
MPVWLDRALAYALLMGIGVAIIYAAKRFDGWYRPRYGKEFRDNPGQRMGWDVLWTLATQRSPIVFAFWGPLFGWLLIVLGGVALADLLIRNW